MRGARILELIEMVSGPIYRLAQILACFLCLCAGVAHAQTPATITSPLNGATLGGASQAFTWDAAAGAELYQLWVGNTPGAYDIGYFPASGTMDTSTTAEGLPTDGRLLYVRLWTAIGGQWYSTDATYMAATQAQPAIITSPANGASLASSTQLFQWNAAPGATLYQLWIGNSPGAFDIGYFPPSGTAATSVMVEGLPDDGRTLYVTLWSAIDGAWRSSSATYTATSPGAAIVSPADGSTLVPSMLGSTPYFAFDYQLVARASLYQLWIGSQPGGNDYVVATREPNDFPRFQIFSRLPRDSRTLYARLWTLVDGTTYYYRDYTYQAAAPPDIAAIDSPAAGSTLPYEPTFTWNRSGADGYELWIGTTPGGSDLKKITGLLDFQTQVRVTGLPFDGRTVYVRLVSVAGPAAAGWNDYAYTLGAPAALLSPADGTTVGTRETFTWNAVSGASGYRLLLSTSATGAPAIASFSLPSNTTSQTVDNLPGGGTLYVKLLTNVLPAAGGLLSLERSYTFNLPPAQPASIALPAPGEVLQGPTQTFEWDWSVGARQYQLWIGSAPGIYDYGYFPAALTTQTSVTVTGLPTDGRTLYVRLWTIAGEERVFNDYTYVAGPATIASEIAFPGVGGIITSVIEPQAFRWNATPGAYGYQLWVGSTPGAYDVGYFPAGLAGDTSVSVTGLPADGRRLFVRLWTATPDGYEYRDYGYAAIKSGDAILRMPTGGWALPGPANAFGGAVGMGSQANLRMVIGNSVGSSEFGSGAVGGLQTQFNNLPIDGRTLYARQSWTLNGEPRFRDYEMTAAQPGPAAVMLSPPNDFGFFAVGTQFGFRFSDVGATQYKIWAGTGTGNMDYGEYFAAPGSTSITVTVPAGRVPTSIRLWSLVDGVWYFRDYKYQHFSG